MHNILNLLIKITKKQFAATQAIISPLDQPNISDNIKIEEDKPIFNSNEIFPIKKNDQYSNTVVNANTMSQTSYCHTKLQSRNIDSILCENKFGSDQISFAKTIENKEKTHMPHFCSNSENSAMVNLNSLHKKIQNDKTCKRSDLTIFLVKEEENNISNNTERDLINNTISTILNVNAADRENSSYHENSSFQVTQHLTNIGKNIPCAPVNDIKELEKYTSEKNYNNQKNDNIKNKAACNRDINIKIQ